MVSDDGSEDPPAVKTRLEFPPESRRRARRLAWLYMAAGIILLPWIVYLADTLPRRQFDRHYRAAWVGFDIFLVLVIIRTAYMAFRVDPRVQFPATATATLLAVDAWFDITTSANRTAFFQAVVVAAFIGIRPPSSRSTSPTPSTGGFWSSPIWSGRGCVVQRGIEGARRQTPSPKRPARRWSRSDSADHVVDAGHHLVGELGDDLEGAEVLMDLLDTTGPGDHRGDVWVLRAPGDGQLG